MCKLNHNFSIKIKLRFIPWINWIGIFSKFSRIELVYGHNFTILGIDLAHIAMNIMVLIISTFVKDFLS